MHSQLITIDIVQCQVCTALHKRVVVTMSINVRFCAQRCTREWQFKIIIIIIIIIGVITQTDSPWFPRGSPEGAPQILI